MRLSSDPASGQRLDLQPWRHIGRIGIRHDCTTMGSRADRDAADDASSSDDG